MKSDIEIAYNGIRRKNSIINEVRSNLIRLSETITFKSHDEIQKEIEEVIVKLKVENG